MDPPIHHIESFSHFLPTPSQFRPSSSRQASFQHGTASKPSTSSFVNCEEHGQHGGQQQQQQKQQQRMAADQAYRATLPSKNSASHERAVFQEEARARARRRDAARNRALFRGPFYRRPEFYAVTLGFLGLLYPIVNQYLVQPWFESMKKDNKTG
ncbi:hypothetical protein F4804DRAFT_350520 [Jackrogersella minutella]|nr:hypothetical protein F4804DRAFT_350520 [Jackrogersella minutella]